MPSLSPSQKQAISVAGMTVLGAAAAAVEQALANPPFTFRSLLVAGGVGAMVGVSHLLQTWGSAAKVEAKVESKATEKAVGMVNEIVSQEAK
jgi:chromosomal replication initiation ATPase DnaA